MLTSPQLTVLTASAMLPTSSPPALTESAVAELALLARSTTLPSVSASPPRAPSLDAVHLASVASRTSARPREPTSSSASATTPKRVQPCPSLSYCPDAEVGSYPSNPSLAMPV